ncbi:PEP-CTERM sorting domain-containing protein [Roseibacillus persicicus]|uniref:PEP-CTERM sorting domain-containing protein n=1 Tax=Roseibacillus persicicus TaxID=454148 RepID=UPI00280E3535|nr:PEP-CTERM sorting domain-containing protein [Roseibacillus persicicus]MDQ8188953.1 PEP-CTERM sorting domain-containing protein [Roseibacillus persicicus]
MKKTKFIPGLAACFAATSLSSPAAVLIAGIDTWASTTAPTPTAAAGITATATASATGGDWSNSDGTGRGSSDDGTWGTTDLGTPSSTVSDVGSANFTLTNAKTDGQITITIVNGSGLDIDLDSFHFDALAFRPKAARTYSVNVLAGSDITVGTVASSEGNPQNDNSTNDITHLGGSLSGHNQHDDLDIDLTGLADSILEAGGTAIFQLAFSNGVGDSSGGHHLFLDNVAVSGDFIPIPEPSSIALLGLSGLALLRRRR